MTASLVFDGTDTDSGTLGPSGTFTFALTAASAAGAERVVLVAGTGTSAAACDFVSCTVDGQAGTRIGTVSRGPDDGGGAAAFVTAYRATGTASTSINVVVTYMASGYMFWRGLRLLQALRGGHRAGDHRHRGQRSDAVGQYGQRRSRDCGGVRLSGRRRPNGGVDRIDRALRQRPGFHRRRVLRGERGRCDRRDAAGDLGCHYARPEYRRRQLLPASPSRSMRRHSGNSGPNWAAPGRPAAATSATPHGQRAAPPMRPPSVGR